MSKRRRDSGDERPGGGEDKRLRDMSGPAMFRQHAVRRESDQERYAREYAERLRQERRRISLEESMQAMRLAQEAQGINIKKRTRESDSEPNKRLREANPIDVLLDALYQLVNGFITHLTGHQIKYRLKRLESQILSPEQRGRLNDIMSTIRTKNIRVPELHKEKPEITF